MCFVAVLKDVSADFEKGDNGRVAWAGYRGDLFIEYGEMSSSGGK
jgi:hypothetical protein